MSPARGAYDYGRNGRIGVGTPQANPTVETEFSILLPPSIQLLVSRLVCTHADPRARLVTYLKALDTSLATYGRLKLSAYGFACTGSSYLVEPGYEQHLVQGLAEKYGYPIITAAQAITDVLKRRDIKRIALVAPYPDDIIDAACRYWTDAGFEIVARKRVVTRTDNTETIYELSSNDAAAALAAFDPGGAEAVLVSGTGMPSLAALSGAGLNVPVFSSNLCLAWRLLDITGAAKFLEPEAPGIAGWQGRLQERLEA